MRFKFLGLIAAVALVAACETAPEEGAATSGTGQASTQPAASSGATTASRLEPRPGTQEHLVATVGDRVFFDYDKYSLKPEARSTLEAQAAWMSNYPAVTITIEGHCDERGTREYNLALGERRANSVKDYLVALGVSPSRIKTLSYGKERPVAMGSNETAWAQNRRGVTLVSGGAGS